jgi:hypothetical protein
MDSNAVDKFAGLFAKCAAAGDREPLRKEAAAQSLVKEAITATQLLMPLGGAALGGAAGYLGTDNEKRKLRNALYGALTGGVAGTGAQLASPMIKDILSRFSGGGAPAAAAQGGGQFSVAPEQPAAKATGAATPAAVTVPSSPAPTAAETAKREAADAVNAAPNDAGMPGAPMNNARYVNDASGAILGGVAVDRVGARFAPGRLSGRYHELNRLALKNQTVNNLLYAMGDKSKPATDFLKPPQKFRSTADKPRMTPVEAQAAAKAWRQKQDAIEYIRRTGSIGNTEAQRRAILPVLEESMRTQAPKPQGAKGKPNADLSNVRTQLDNKKDVFVGRPSLKGWRGLRAGAGGVAGLLAADTAHAKTQNALAAKLQQNPNYGLGDLGKDIYGTGRDLVQQPAAFGKGLGAGLYDHYLRGFVENKK